MWECHNIVGPVTDGLDEARLPEEPLPSWIADALSCEQKRPLLRATPNSVVLAGAGSGKTRTLVHMLLHDLANGVPTESIVAFTFTEKAADELLARVHSVASTKLPGLDLTGLSIGTIHSWCFHYLLKQSRFYNFSSLDELHVDALVSRLYDHIALTSSYGKPYPRAIPDFLADLEIFYNEFIELQVVPKRIRASIASFLDLLEKNRLLTYGGMIYNACKHLEEAGEPTGLSVVYVDEYQDVNPAQVRLLKAMLPKGGRLSVVGDDLQCIYNWRGSDVTRILSFAEEFGNADISRLSANHRSRPDIVHIGNSIADHLVLRDAEKVMIPARPALDCDCVHWLSVSSEEEQAQVVVDIVTAFLAHGVPCNSIAVLLRSVAGSGQPIVAAMKAAGVPAICPLLSRAGALIREFILPILDWLRGDHPQPKSQREEAQAEESADTLWRNVQPWVQGADPSGIFWAALNDWLHTVEAKAAAAYDVRGRLYDLLERCGIAVHPDDSDLMVGLGIASQIVRSVEEIHRRRLADQPRRTPRGIISEAYFALQRNHETFGESVPIEKIGNGVCVTTIHQAKGLEWPVVIIPMLRDRKFPLSNRPHGTSFPDKIACRYGTTVEDERRLFYVAATRAKERLFLIAPENDRPERRSIFLRDIAADSLLEAESLDMVPAAAWSIAQDDLRDVDAPPIRIGLSDVLLYLDCPYQYALARIVNIEPSVGDELGYGKSLHELIQRRLEAGADWTAEELSKAAQEHVFLPYMSAEGEAKARTSIAGRVQALLKAGLLEAQVESEIDVELILDGGIVQGTIDAIQLEPDGSVRVRDWKSSVHEGYEPRYDAQLVFYSEALRRQGRTVRAADVVDVKESAKAGGLVCTEVDIGPGATNQLLREIDAAIVGIRDGDYASRPRTRTCSVCDMRRICGERDLG